MPPPQGQPTIVQTLVRSRKNLKDYRNSTKSIVRVGHFGSIGNLASLSFRINHNRVEDAAALITPRVPNDAFVRLKYHILVVDDSGLNRKLLCKTLRAAGHSCEEAADGLLALNKVSARQDKTRQSNAWRL